MAKGATSTTPVATSREPRGEDLIARYRAKYGIPAGVSLTEEQVMFHWRLERSLTAQLLASTPESRWETFERCYSELYRSLPWLQEGEAEQTADDSAEHALWSSLLGSAPRDVYEVGSGDGALARYLAAHGYRCRATEITRERGDRTEEAGLSWGQTDGVNLGSFEVGESFDAVISNQVLEHLHPADLSAHLGAAHGLLRARGRIAFATPHRFTGPHDVSQVFDRDEAEGMHLHEYTYRELVALLREAGFVDVRAPLRLPTRVRARLGGRPQPILSRAYLRYLMALERLLGLVGDHRRRRSLARVLWVALFTDNIVLVACRKG